VDDFKTFLEQGFDSLILTQISLAIEKKFGVKVPFRRLFEDANSVDQLARYIDSQLPAAPVVPAERTISPRSAELNVACRAMAQPAEFMRAEVRPTFSGEPCAPINLEAELRAMSRVEQRLTQTLGIKDITACPGLERELNALCSAYICDYLQSCHITIEAGRRYSIGDLHSALKLRPVYRKFLHYMLSALAEDGILRLDSREIEWLRKPGELPNSLALHQRLLEQFPEFHGLLEMLQHCARHYREALAGDILGVSVLLPGGRHDFVKQHLKHYTDYYKCTRIYEGVARELVLSLSQKSPLRILEVGGGSGELTWQLAPELAGRGCEYHFSDVGRSFVQSARQEAARRDLDFMKFGVFDISKAPAPQGYAPKTFHVVLALNVVHATAHVGESLAQLKTLLMPGGLICLVELTRYQRWDSMIIGLADGWWLFDDAPRKDSPLLQLSEWEQQFRNQGFMSVSTFPSDPRQRDRTDAGLVVAQCDAPAHSESYFVTAIISIVTVLSEIPTPLTFALDAAGALCGL
jgi:2-polyprenyl-3-methyl-5-hydroxy-6-metoxy-1,4-benzoquinol methylase